MLNTTKKIILIFLAVDYIFVYSVKLLHYGDISSSYIAKTSVQFTKQTDNPNNDSWSHRKHIPLIKKFSFNGYKLLYLDKSFEKDENFTLFNLDFNKKLTIQYSSCNPNKAPPLT